MNRPLLALLLLACGCITPPPAERNGSSDDAGTASEPDIAAMPDVGSSLDSGFATDSGTDGPDTSVVLDAGGLVTVEFQDGVSPSAAYDGTRDAEISSSSPDSNYGTESDIQADEEPAILVKWNISQIPQTATVVDAYIELTSGADSSSDDFDVFLVNGPWAEDEVTWNNASSGRSWQEPGCQGVEDRTQTSVGTVSNAMSFEKMVIGPSPFLRDRVSNWVRNPSRSYGITIQKFVSDINGFHISSRESTEPSYRPKLVVTYRP